MQSIIKYISQFRRQYANLALIKNLLVYFSCILIITILFISIEKIFYLSPINRENLIVFVSSISIISLFYIILVWIIKYKALLGINTDAYIAKKIGVKDYSIKDKLINIIQLYKKSPNLDLTKLAIHNIKQVIGRNPIKDFKILFPYKFLYTFLICIVMISLLLISENSRKALNRMQKYHKKSTFKNGEKIFFSRFGFFETIFLDF